MKERIQRSIQDSIDTKLKVLQNLVPDIEKAAQILVEALRSGQKVLFFGNGGSASDAQHLAAELVGRFERERPGLAALALTTDRSILTAVSNDYSFAKVFARQVESLGRKGDIAVGITTSGNSRNVILGVERARQLGLRTVVLTGHDGGRIRGKADCEILVPSSSTSRIQESHILIGHILCDLVDEALIGPR